MKSVILNNTQIKTSGFSFPDVISLEQFDNGLWNYKNATINSGSRGNVISNNHAFGVSLGSSGNFAALKEFLIKGRYEHESMKGTNVERKVSIKYLEEKFYLLEVNDIGGDATSFGFIDVLPLCFYGGKKIRQSHVGFFRYSAKRKLLILIDKGIGVGNDPNFTIILTPSLILNSSNSSYPGDLNNNPSHQDYAFNNNLWDHTISYENEDITTNFKHFGHFMDCNNEGGDGQKDDVYVSSLTSSSDSYSYSYNDISIKRSIESVSSVGDIGADTFLNAIFLNKEYENNKSFDSFIDNVIENNIKISSSKFIEKGNYSWDGTQRQDCDYFFYDNSSLLGCYKRSPESVNKTAYEEIPSLSPGKKTIVDFSIESDSNISSSGAKTTALKAAHIYRWNLENNFYQIYNESGSLQGENLSSGNYSLISYDDNEGLNISAGSSIQAGVNLSIATASPTDNFIYTIPENPYLNLENGSNFSYNEGRNEYFLHRWDPGFESYSGETIVDVIYNDNGASRLKDVSSVYDFRRLSPLPSMGGELIIDIYKSGDGSAPRINGSNVTGAFEDLIGIQNNSFCNICSNIANVYSNNIDNSGLGTNLSNLRLNLLQIYKNSFDTFDTNCSSSCLKEIENSEIEYSDGFYEYQAIYVKSGNDSSIIFKYADNTELTENVYKEENNSPDVRNLFILSGSGNVTVSTNSGEPIYGIR